jgi:hypothetical protein
MSDRDRPQYLRVLAEFAGTADVRTLGADVVDRVRWIIADCIPVIAVGMQTLEMKTLVAKHLTGAVREIEADPADLTEWINVVSEHSHPPVEQLITSVVIQNKTARLDENRSVKWGLQRLPSSAIR